MKSLPPQDYRALPQLAPPAGYICVIRDIDGGCYRLEGAGNVAELINAALDEVSKKFGIELISILETDDIKATESALYADHHAKLSSAWLALDPYQLDELARIHRFVDHYGTDNVFIAPDKITAGYQRLQ